MQCRSRMVHSDHKPVAYFSHLPVDLGDLRSFEEQAHRETTERHNDTRIDDLNLVLKIIAGANFDLIGQRIAVPGWTALDDVRDPYIGARHASLLKQLIQEFSRRADKWASLFVFVKARSFSNEHDLRMSWSFARYCFFAQT